MLRIDKNVISLCLHILLFQFSDCNFLIENKALHSHSITLILIIQGHIQFNVVFIKTIAL